MNGIWGFVENLFRKRIASDLEGKKIGRIMEAHVRCFWSSFPRS